MKRLMILLLISLLLCGCITAQTPQSKPKTEGAKVIVTDVPTLMNEIATAKPQKNDPQPQADAVTRPPALTVSAGERSVTASLSTYSWVYDNSDGTATGIDADGLHPLEAEPYMEPLPLGDAETITLSFAPDCTLIDVSIRAWDESLLGDFQNDEAFYRPVWMRDGDTITIKPIGSAVYEVYATFTGAGRGSAYYAVWTTDGKTAYAVPFTSETIRIGWAEHYETEPVLPVRDAETLRSLLEPHFIPDDGGIDERNTALQNAIDAYDEAFFAEHDLLVLREIAGSGSVRFETLYVGKDAAGLSVTVCITVPEVGTADMGAWLLLVSLPKGLVNSADDVCVHTVTEPA
ncbi:MAG: hypothetical protein IJP98_03720 [Clostridia bacterium]|nr:hypothetical protein [Clostridia bacterium]